MVHWHAYCLPFEILQAAGLITSGLLPMAISKEQWYYNELVTNGVRAMNSSVYAESWNLHNPTKKLTTGD